MKNTSLQLQNMTRMLEVLCGKLNATRIDIVGYIARMYTEVYYKPFRSSLHFSSLVLWLIGNGSLL